MHVPNILRSLKHNLLEINIYRNKSPRLLLAWFLVSYETEQTIPPYCSDLSFISRAGAPTEPPIFFAADPLVKRRGLGYGIPHVA